MSNKTTLQSNNALLSQNNTDLQALINTANALPDAGGGGGSVETCIVSVNTAVIDPQTYKHHIFYTAYENGSLVSKCLYCSSSAKTYMLDNVVCGTMVRIPHCYAIPDYRITGGTLIDSNSNGQVANYAIVLIQHGITEATIIIEDD